MEERKRRGGKMAEVSFALLCPLLGTGAATLSQILVSGLSPTLPIARGRQESIRYLNIAKYRSPNPAFSRNPTKS